MINQRGRGSVRALAAAVAVASALPVAQSALAEEAQLEEVVVTGSRIARDPNQTAPSPVQTLGEAEIRLSGQLDVADILREQPALLTTTSSVGSVDGVFATQADAVGQSVLQLRGLGNERTLVLVNGRRHVSGVQGSQAVDVGTIPSALIQRVEVLTGGASSLYGADAVTGVVNFILKDDFEGMDIDVQTGISGAGDSESYQLSGLFGKNLFDGRANITIGIDYTDRKPIKAGDRNFSDDNGIADARGNPALRFQQGDIDADTPNFAQYFGTGANRVPVGFEIPPTAQNFIDRYTAEFGSAPNLTPAEQALIDRAASAPPRFIDTQHTFSISSAGGVLMGASGLISPFPAVDLDGNGQHDCLDSYVGYNSTDEFFAGSTALAGVEGSFGFLGGCWNIAPDGTVAPYQDGAVATNTNHFGGDGIQNVHNGDYLTPDEQKIAINVNGHFDITPQLRLFGEAKYVQQEVEFGGPLNTFWDLLQVRRDNPYVGQLPQELQTYLNSQSSQDGFLPFFSANPIAPDAIAFITRDPKDMGPNIDQNTRETMRFVVGLEGEMDNGWLWDAAVNYGQFEREFQDRNRVIVDRYFASIDAVADPVSGDPICRSDIDPSAPFTTPFDIPLFKSGYYTFNPGDGQCRPANLLGGIFGFAGPGGGISPEAVDFITDTVVNEYTLTQFVVNANLTGDTGIELPGGEIAFAVGGEYRQEGSEAEYDPLVLGRIPVDTPDANAGQLLTEVNPDQDPTDGIDPFQNSLVFDPATQLFDYDEDFDVWEIYAELSMPLLSDAPFARELTFDLSGRYSDYDTIGTTETYAMGLAWAPVDDVRLRGTYSRAVRAPNIFELFGREGAFFRPDDPCDNAIVAAQPEPEQSNRIANCASDGIDATVYSDPLTARFSGLITGNEDLSEETADTFTVGIQLAPRFAEGLSVSVDYWDIEIEDAIEAVASQDIVDGCYDADPGAFPNQFCDLFTRRGDGGLNFLRQSQLNLGAIETNGVDFQVGYEFEALGGRFNADVVGTWVDEINRFFDPDDPSAVDPELGEVQRPEWAGTASLAFMRGPVLVRWRTLYQDEQLARDAEIESFQGTYGDVAVQDEFYSHDVSFQWDVNQTFQLYGGVNNLTDEEPNLQEGAWPVSPVGRYFFLGLTYATN
jgi:outer membrane receptor protein involved in Fe transport